MSFRGKIGERKNNLIVTNLYRAVPHFLAEAKTYSGCQIKHLTNEDIIGCRLNSHFVLPCRAYSTPVHFDRQQGDNPIPITNIPRYQI
jgi:hypothetical protein